MSSSLSVNAAAPMEMAMSPKSSAASKASAVAARAWEISQDEKLDPQVRLLGAQALLDDLARTLARVLVEDQPDASPPSAPSL